MADKKISQLNAAATPLAGAEILPIVQGGNTVKVSVADLTAGRAVTADSIANGLGAEGTPSYTFTGDTNTGMWSPAADTVAFSTAGSERLRVSSTGNLLVGKTSLGIALVGAEIRQNGTLTATRDSDTPFFLNRNTTDGVIASFLRDASTVGSISVTTTATSYNTSSASGITGVDANTVAFRTNSAERMRITSAGLVGIGTSAPAQALHVKTASTGGMTLQVNSITPDDYVRLNFLTSTAEAGTSQLWISGVRGATAGSSFLTVGTNDTERMRITGTGNVGIGEPAPDYRLDVNGTFGFTPGASVTPVDNGDVVFELTNNTTLTIKAKGSDGVVRSGTIILV